ncbi:ParA family protein [Occallatibacter riparius]|uniref:ParA family protein n=2 Tax=Occallatibacter riparius TaxID=1002689 RepID=A0A9J7BQK2_9BACT|nr:ParA family protein [Occallatibacter riparius]
MNMKGGVGKTTLSVNVAYALAYFHKRKVLIVDGDPQFNASQYLMSTKAYLQHINDPKKGTLKEIFVPRKAAGVNTVTGLAKTVDKSKMSLNSCTCTIFDGGAGRGKLDLIPSTLSLIEIETSKRGTESKLKSYLKEKATGYDYVIIDCPPTISIFTQAAILASDKYLVPLKPDPLSVVGLPLLERWLEEYTDDAGMKIEPVGLVFTLVRGPLPAAMREAMEEVRATRKDEVFRDILSQATDVAKSVAHHEPVFRYNRNAKASAQILGITNELVERTAGV